MLLDFDRAVKVFNEFVSGCRGLYDIGPAVTVFGSAWLKEDHRYYQMARELGRELVEKGFAVVTGGGPGIMEAANRGAREAGGLSVGCNIDLPMEQELNPYVDVTLDEMFETLTLVQTGKMRTFPCVAMGEDYWKPMIDFVAESKHKEGTVAPGEVDVEMWDSPEKAASYIRDQIRLSVQPEA